MLFRILLIFIVTLGVQNAVVAQTNGETVDDSLILRSVGNLKGKVIIKDKDGFVMPNSWPLYFERIGKENLVFGIKTDLEGNFGIRLGAGEYRLITKTEICDSGGSCRCYQQYSKNQLSRFEIIAGKKFFLEIRVDQAFKTASCKTNVNQNRKN